MQVRPCSPTSGHRSHRDDRHDGRLNVHLQDRYDKAGRDVHDAFRE